MRVALFGIYGAYNFGCEAIVRGAYQFLKNIYGDCSITYYSYSYEYDKDVFSDLPIDIKEIQKNDFLITRIINKTLSILDVNKRLPRINIDNIISNSDMVLSIGGDLYTIPLAIRSKNKYPYYNSMIDYCSRIIRAGKQVIVYGASVGPWGKNTKAINYYRKHMSYYRAILCREFTSIEYLRSLGLNNSCFFPDPAFLLSKGVNRTGTSIGINFSPLSLIELHGSLLDKEVKKLAELVDKIILEFKRSIVFLPHVISNNENDNDLLFLQKIKEMTRNKETITIADTTQGFFGIKEQLKDCYMVVSARMHCSINAIEENIPTIFLSYSQKSIGMCEYVYRNKEWVIAIDETHERIITKMREMNMKHILLSEYLKTRNKEIREEYEHNISKVKALLY